MMETNKREQEALARIYELLGEYADSRYVQHLLTEDLETILRFIEKCAKK